MHRNSVHLCLPPSHCKALFKLFHLFYTARHCSITHSIHLCLLPLTLQGTQQWRLRIVIVFTSASLPSHCKTLFNYFTFSSSRRRLRTLQVIVFTLLPPSPHTARHCSSISPFLAAVAITHRNSVHCLLPHTARHCSTISLSSWRLRIVIVFTVHTARHCSTIFFLAAVAITHRNSVHLCLPPSHCKTLFNYFTFSSSSEITITHRNSVHLCLPPSLPAHTARHCSTISPFLAAVEITHRNSVHLCLPPHTARHCSTSSPFLAAVEITHRNSVHLCSLPHTARHSAVEITHRNSVHLCLPPSHCKALFNYFTFFSSSGDYTCRIVFTSASLPHTARHSAVEITHRNSIHLCLPPSHCKALFIYFTFLAAVAITHRNSIHLCLPSLTLQGTQQWRLRIVIVFTSASLPHTARHCSTISPFLAAVAITHRNSVHLCLLPSHCKALFNYFPFLAAVAITHRNSVHLCLPRSHCKALFIYFTFFSSSGDYASGDYSGDYTARHCSIVFFSSSGDYASCIPPSSLTLQGTRIVMHRNSVHLCLPPHTARHCSTISPFLAAVAITHRNSVHLCLPPLTLQGTQQWRLRIVIVFTSASLPPHTARHCSTISPFLAAVAITHRNSIHLCLLPHTARHSAVEITHRNSVHLCLPPPLTLFKTLFASISPLFTLAVQLDHHYAWRLVYSPLPPLPHTARHLFTSALPPSHCKALFIYFTFFSTFFTSASPHSKHCSITHPFSVHYHRNAFPPLPHTARHCSTISPFLAAVAITHRNSNLCPSSHCKALFLPFLAAVAKALCSNLSSFPSHCKALFKYFTFLAAVAIAHRNSVHLCLPSLTLQGTQWRLRIDCSPLPPSSHCKALFNYFTFSASGRIVIVFTSASLPHTARHSAVEITHRNSVHLCLHPSHCKALFNYFTFSSSSGDYASWASVHLCLPLPHTARHLFTSASLPHTARHCSTISPFLAAVAITHRNSVHLCLPPHTQDTQQGTVPSITQQQWRLRIVFTSASSLTLQGTVHLFHLFSSSSGDYASSSGDYVFTSASLPHTARHSSTISLFLAAVAITHRNSIHLPPSHCKALSRRLRIVIVFTSASLPHTARHCSSISPFLAAVEITHRNSVHLCLLPTLQGTQQWRLRIVIVFNSASLPHTARHCSSISPFLAAVAITHRNSVHLCLPPSHCKALFIYFTLFLAAVELRIVIVFTSASSLTLQGTCSPLPPSLTLQALFIYFTFFSSRAITHRNSVHLCLPPPLQGTVHPFTFFSSSGDTHRNSVHLCLPPLTLQGTVQLFHLFSSIVIVRLSPPHTARHCSTSPLPPSLTLQGTQQWRLRIVIVFTSASLPHTARHCSTISPFLAAVAITHRNSVHLCLPPSHCKTLFIYFTFSSSSGDYASLFTSASLPHTARHCSSISPFLAAVAITHRNSVHLCLPPLTLQDTVQLFFTFLAAVEITHVHLCLLPHTARHCSPHLLAAVAITHRNSVHLCLPSLTLQGTVHLFHLFSAVAITHRVSPLPPSSHSRHSLPLF
ncbi:unnamed protein product [Acanthosepion pharaonis]|uniref:Uncharacterized protein n=1 Tax=Acanthosepion pharaonis TaxID=158019 RepID=A0A812DEM9_ACAPH|nr:unnamed protein product [Sepia pharaonis]